MVLRLGRGAHRLHVRALCRSFACSFCSAPPTRAVPLRRFLLASSIAFVAGCARLLSAGSELICDLHRSHALLKQLTSAGLWADHVKFSLIVCTFRFAFAQWRAGAFSGLNVGRLCGPVVLLFGAAFGALHLPPTMLDLQVEGVRAQCVFLVCSLRCVVYMCSVVSCPVIRIPSDAIALVDMFVCAATFAKFIEQLNTKLIELNVEARCVRCGAARPASQSPVSCRVLRGVEPRAEGSVLGCAA